MFRRFHLCLIAACLAPAIAVGASRDHQAAEKPRHHRQLIDALKRIETGLGFAPTRNFARADGRVTAYYRCYFTGAWELPNSYAGLKLRSGTRSGCSVDTAKYDVFFYPIEAVASGNVPITGSLDAAPDERVAMVVPHEDFHAQVRPLPGPIAEAAATLVGFLTADAYRDAGGASRRTGEAELFLQKAEIVNRYYGRLRELYRDVREGSVTRPAALERKRVLFSELADACRAIAPAPRTFNQCLSAPNNAGLAFDHTYTLYYPLLYRVFVAEGRDLKATIAVIGKAPRARRERDVAQYFARVAAIPVSGSR